MSNLSIYDKATKAVVKRATGLASTLAKLMVAVMRSLTSGTMVSTLCTGIFCKLKYRNRPIFSDITFNVLNIQT